MGKPQIKLNVLDKIACYLNPAGAARRVHARAMLSAAEGAGYVTFGSGRRSMRGAMASPQSADADSIPKLEMMRASSRDMYMNAPVATAALRRARTNIVGYGLSLQARIDRDTLNLTDDEAQAWEKKAERGFHIWANSRECDATRTQSFYDMQATALLSILMSGDLFIAMPYIKRKGVPFDLKLKMIEADMVSNPLGKTESSQCAGGVEVDVNGAPVKYHFHKTHPGDFLPTYGWVEVPAYSASGRRQIIHLFVRERPNQRRGIPMLAPVVDSLKQLTRYAESELMAAVVSSFFTAFVKSNASGDVLADGFADSEKVSGSSGTAIDQNIYEMGHGSIVGLNPGEDVVLADPKRPNSGFDKFFESVVKQIGAALEMPSEWVMLSFTSSYSASRAALLEAWKYVHTYRAWLSRELCQPVYEEWLEEAITKRFLDAPGFFSDPIIRSAWCGSKWSGPGQGQLNPVQETQAALMRIKGNLSTHTKETAAIDGDNWETMVSARGREEVILEVQGLTSVSQGMKTPGLEPDNAFPSPQPDDPMDPAIPPGDEPAEGDLDE